MSESAWQKTGPAKPMLWTKQIHSMRLWFPLACPHFNILTHHQCQYHNFLSYLCSQSHGQPSALLWLARSLPSTMFTGPRNVVVLFHHTHLPLLHPFFCCLEGHLQLSAKSLLNFSIPIVKTALEHLRGNTIFIKLDLRSAYKLVWIYERSLWACPLASVNFLLCHTNWSTPPSWNAWNACSTNLQTSLF